MHYQLRQAEQAPTCRVPSDDSSACRKWLQARQHLVARLPREVARPGNPDFDGIAACTERLLGALLHSLQCCVKAQPAEWHRQLEQEVSHDLKGSAKVNDGAPQLSLLKGTARAAARGRVALSLLGLICCCALEWKHSILPSCSVGGGSTCMKRLCKHSVPFRIILLPHVFTCCSRCPCCCR